ncbi:response regulator transcription factor [Tepidimicrobium xylanilyticum]|uniref:Two-component system, OmpR family, alkaline phosphatase synthesis response regulator PhoP n=1 Tax=Tepidimicrobium xylanilyticum TaxID=1123352 RepID=A0A1H3CEK2_9FIRM|nr:response regulator transcription factor [Tepidimicrobium xylanilyticum]SDX52622.1 two-component system, OmpR family, alkaline phosphatase synthesis response regulator PhoP [Tepidimicrobium xylanilyticum]
MPLIYCIEDDESIRELVVYALKNNGFEAVGFESGEGLFNHPLPDLIILDIMLPGDDGYVLLKKLKSNFKTSDIPVIMLTAKTSEYDKVKSLDMGADDYIEKPFGIMELISRVKAVMRRTSRDRNNKLNFNEISINYGKRLVTVNGKEISLTHKEFELLTYLMKNQGLVLSRNQIMNQVWGFDFEGETRTIDVHIRTLRLKLGDAGKYIQTIRNVGYKLGD